MVRRLVKRATTTATTIVTTTDSAVYDVSQAKLFSLQAVVDVNTPAAKTFADGDVTVGSDLIAIASHGFVTGLKVAATTSGVLPGGLSATNYFVIVVSSGTIKLASSLANALAGTVVDITSAAGGGTHTLTPAAIAGASLTVLKSNDYEIQTGVGTWDAVESATSISADADIWISDIDPEYRYMKFQYTLTAGQLSAVSTLVIKEDL